MKTYCSVLPKMLWRTWHWVVFWIESHKNELVEVKVTDFQRQRRKNLVSAQCVTCSGGLVITNFEIPASKISSCGVRLQIRATFLFIFMKYRKPSAMVCKHFIFLWQEIPYFISFLRPCIFKRWGRNNQQNARLILWLIYCCCNYSNMLRPLSEAIIRESNCPCVLQTVAAI
jgi:hypothetical protein